MNANIMRKGSEIGESPHRGEPHGYRWAEARAVSNVTCLVTLIRDSKRPGCLDVGLRAAPLALICDFD